MEDESAAQQIDAIIKRHDNWRGEMLSRLRALIKQNEAALQALMLEAVELKKSKAN